MNDINDPIWGELNLFMQRMERIGITLKLSGNIPWIYLESINGHRVKEEDFTSNHGFTFGWYPKLGSKFTFDDLPETFKIIRKYR